MRLYLASRIMRTTIDIDDPVLRDLKRLQKRDGRPLGRLVSDLLARATAEELRKPAHKVETFDWVSAPMGARIDLADRDAVRDVMDRDDG
jgi:hypothetical protein